jgi:hypothetical protein
MNHFDKAQWTQCQLTPPELLNLVLSHPDCPDQVSTRNLIGKFPLSHLAKHLREHPAVKLAIAVEDDYYTAQEWGTTIPF